MEPPFISARGPLRLLSLPHPNVAEKGDLKEDTLSNTPSFTNVHPHMKIVKKEIFGPVSVIIKFSNKQGFQCFPLVRTVQSIHFTEVIDAANDTEYGLARHIFTENVSRAVRVAHAIEAGTSWVGAISFFCFLSTESSALYSGQLRRVWASGHSFWRVQAAGGGEGVWKARLGYVRSRSFSSICV